MIYPHNRNSRHGILDLEEILMAVTISLTRVQYLKSNDINLIALKEYSTVLL